MNEIRFHRALTAGLLALLGASWLSGETTVTLNSSASPTAADPGVTSVSVTGHGFPSGTIPPANVTVTLNPATTGAGPSGTTTATKVTVVSGTTERVTFKVPTSISVTTPTAYEVSISGSTESGTAFESGNTASLTVNAPVTVTTASPLPEGSVNVSYSETLTATGGAGSYTWAVSSGSLPAGLTLGSAGVISGTPSTKGASHFGAKATDTDKASKSKEFTLVIESTLSITTNSPLPAGTVNVGYSQTLAATGGTAPYTWSVSGSLPAGLTLSAAGQITGTPSASGTPSFTIQVTDSKEVSTSKVFSVTINPALVITTTSPLPTGTVSVAYNQALAATGGSGQYTWSVSSGSLPSGLTLAAATGVISGTPGAAGAPSFTIQVTDTNSVTATKPFSVTINAALVITTNSPLPAGTVNVGYAQSVAATGGSGQYSWSVSSGSLPAGLTLAASTGLISGTPSAAGSPSFTIRVTDTNMVSAGKAFSVTIDPALQITTTSPLPTAEVAIAYNDTLSATGGSGRYTWSISAGTLPGGLTLVASNGLITGTPTTPATVNFTIMVTDSNQATATQPAALTVNPAAQLQTLNPNLSYQGLSLEVAITGLNTHFVQGTTVANFGPGISVNGAVTVNSATSATASITISPTATVQSQTVTVTTGAETESLTNGFTVDQGIAITTVTTTSISPLAPGFSGFADEYLIHGVEFWDPKLLAMVEPLKPGWIRFPGGAPSMTFDWQTAHMNTSWMSELEPKVPSFIYSGFEDGLELTQAKGGACFSGGTCVSDYGTFVKTIGANAIVDFNGYTDNLTNSIGLMETTAQSAGIPVVEWEIDNEPFVYNKIYPTPASYVAAANPYYLDLSAANPDAVAAVFYQGPWDWVSTCPDGITAPPCPWDSGMAAISPIWWQGVSVHIYPISDSSTTTTNEEQLLNGVLAHGTTEWFSSYLTPLIGNSMPVYFTEMNTDGFATMPFETYIYNGIFLAEWIARMSTVPQVKVVGVQELFLGNSFDQGIIRAVDDYESYLKAQYNNNNNYSTNTATNPSTQFQFYYSTSALAMEVANTAINSSDATFATAVNGGPTVPIQGYDGNPVPAIYSQGYQGTNGANYVLITNKSNQSVPMAIMVNGTLLEQTLNVLYVSSTSDTAANTATDQNAVQVQTTTSPNPITVGPYSITCISW